MHSNRERPLRSHASVRQSDTGRYAERSETQKKRKGTNGHHSRGKLNLYTYVPIFCLLWLQHGGACKSFRVFLATICISFPRARSVSRFGLPCEAISMSDSPKEAYFLDATNKERVGLARRSSEYAKKDRTVNKQRYTKRRYIRVNIQK